MNEWIANAYNIRAYSQLLCSDLLYIAYTCAVYNIHALPQTYTVYRYHVSEGARGRGRVQFYVK